MSIAAAKTDLGFVQGVALGAFCNGLVCLAVWLCYSARTTTDKILSIVPPIAAFVAAGFEHCVANMFFIPMGLFISGDEAFVMLAMFPGTALPLMAALAVLGMVLGWLTDTIMHKARTRTCTRSPVLTMPAGAKA